MIYNTNVTYVAEEHQTKIVAKSLNLDDTEIEESKRDLITREIGKFREVMKVIIIMDIFISLSLSPVFLLFSIIKRKTHRVDTTKGGILISFKRVYAKKVFHKFIDTNHKINIAHV